MGVKKLVVSGPVVTENGRLCVTKDSKDDFWKIPGGKVKLRESLEACAGREFKEETGMECVVYGELSTLVLNMDGMTNRFEVELHHYSAKLKSEHSGFGNYEHNGHHVSWLPLDELKEGLYNVAPNIKYLLERGEIK